MKRTVTVEHPRRFSGGSVSPRTHVEDTAGNSFRERLGVEQQPVHLGLGGRETHGLQHVALSPHRPAIDSISTTGRGQRPLPRATGIAARVRDAGRGDV
ncbi:hypothetical protein [Actinacidiphila glaucinigra]|uniref:hypothetical protein n=1 Tax=Actinacidiphila glaucinigra TaxID=235986 RepID=UPI0036E4F50C